MATPPPPNSNQTPYPYPPPGPNSNQPPYPPPGPNSNQTPYQGPPPPPQPNVMVVGSPIVSPAQVYPERYGMGPLGLGFNPLYPYPYAYPPPVISLGVRPYPYPYPYRPIGFPII